MMTEIKICMGSACFAKGNMENLKRIKEHLRNNNLSGTIKIIGTLCKNKCCDGPRIVVNDTEYKNVTETKLVEILNAERNKE